MSTTNETDNQCVLFNNHEGDHDPIYEVHKCRGEDCLWCPFKEEDRCKYKLVTVQVWVKEEFN